MDNRESMEARLVGSVLLMSCLAIISFLTPLIPVSPSQQARPPTNRNLDPQSLSQPTAQSFSTSSFALTDRFNYSDITALVNAGWTLCGGSETPPSFYSVSPGELTLANDGTQGAAICWNKIPSQVADWTVTVRTVSVTGWPGSLQLTVATASHTYMWRADAHNLHWSVYQDGIPVWNGPRFWGEEGVWHNLGVDVKNHLLTFYFDEAAFWSYDDSSNTNLKSIILSAAWQTTNGFSYVKASEIDPNAPDFILTVTPSTATVLSGRNATFTIVVTSQNRFTGNVNLTSDISPGFLQRPVLTIGPTSVNVPAGGNANSTLQAATSVYTPENYDYAIRVSAGSGLLVHLAQSVLTVFCCSPGTFTLSFAPSSVKIFQKGDGQWPAADVSLTLTSSGGYSGWASFSYIVFYSPGPFSVSTPQPVLLPPDGMANATLTIDPSANMTQGNWEILLYATINSFYQTVWIPVDFEPSFFTMAVQGSLLAFPGSTSQSTIQLQSHQGFNDTVSVNVSIDVSTGVSLTLTPSQVNVLSNTTQLVTLTVSVSSTIPAGSHTMTITGTGRWWRATFQIVLYIASRPYNPGVQPGIWARYSATFTNATYSLTADMLLTISNVEETNVTYVIDVFLDGKLLNSTTTWLDVATGQNPTPLLPFFLSASNLEAGDSIYIGQDFLPITVQAVTPRPLAGTMRVAVEFQTPAYASAQITVWWDRKTGILGSLEGTVSVQNQPVIVHYTLVDTNGWDRQADNAPAPLTATMSVSPIQSSVGAVISFNGHASGGAPPYSFHWQFGDGQTSDKQNPGHAYKKPGNYIVTLTVTDRQDNAKTTSNVLRITSSPSIPIPISFAMPVLSTLATLATTYGLVITLFYIPAVTLASYLVIRREKRKSSPTA